jgi:hypothetical protein
MTMRLSRIPLFLYLIFKQKLAEAFPLPSEDYTARNFLIHIGSKRKVLVFLKRSGAKAGLVSAKQNKVGRERKRSGKRGELFPGKREGVFNL